MSKTTPDAHLKQTPEEWQCLSLWLVGNWVYFIIFLSSWVLLQLHFPACSPGRCQLPAWEGSVKSSALACWANCSCYKFNIVNSWHNSNLVIVDWSRGKRVHLVFQVGLLKYRWFIILCYVTQDMLAHTDVSGHLQFCVLFQNILILSMNIMRLHFVLILWPLTVNIFSWFCFWKGYSLLKVELI